MTLGEECSEKSGRENRYTTPSILSAEDKPPVGMDILQVLLQDLVEDFGSSLTVSLLPKTQYTIRRLGELMESVDFFVLFCHQTFLMEIPHSKQMPLSSGESLRTYRACLRFHSYAQLFHQREATDGLVSDRNWEQCHLQ